MTQHNATRLTADNYSEDLLEKVLDENQGLLGAYEIREYENLKDVMSEDFTVEWKPSRVDPQAGMVKLRPNSQNGVKRLNRARARALRSRNPWVPMYHAVGFVQATKRHRLAHNEILQDFMLRHYDDQVLHDFIDDDDLPGFKTHINAKMRSDFREDQLETVFSLLKRVQEVMYREIPSRNNTTSEAKTSEEEETPSTEESEPEPEPLVAEQTAETESVTEESTSSETYGAVDAPEEDPAAVSNIVDDESPLAQGTA